MPSCPSTTQIWVLPEAQAQLSSTNPLQLLSSPSQISRVGVEPEHSVQPDSVQVSNPSQVPYSELIEQDLDSPLLDEKQEQEPPAGVHCKPSC
jgi:hypothetical protein